MCGITGFIDISGAEIANLREMTAALNHRGPESDGHWIDQDAGVGLGHRRLAIVDLSPTGHQPMDSTCGRFVIVFNGEIYNFRTLRQELEAQGHRFRGNSDTEVMLAAVVSWGLVAAVKRFNGMFAFALWDRQERVLHLVRDRLGEKPLYYGWVGSIFMFGSELKALRVHPSWRGEIDRGALALQLRHNYIPAPYSIYRNIYKLLPGTVITVRASDTPNCPIPVPYWSAKEMAEQGLNHPFTGTVHEATLQLEALLKDAVQQQMIADVPLGAFLSGGIDSSTIVALMQAQSSRPVQTFTIGFNEKGFDEAEHARAIARHLGTNHTETYVTPREAMSIIPKLPSLYDEPFSDSSQIPTHLVAQLARQKVTVSLSGDAGDELFGGYNRYVWGRRLWDRVGGIPTGVRKGIASGLRSVSLGDWDRLYSALSPVLPSGLRFNQAGHKIHKLADILGAGSAEEMYRGLVSSWLYPTDVVLQAEEPPTLLTDQNKWANLPNVTQRMMFLDLMTYLPDDILVKVDRAAMGVSLETRVPFLDHRVVEFAFQLPLEFNLREGHGKWLLRQVLYKYVPKELIDRPKMGFGIPIGDWLRGPLMEWAETLLSEQRLRDGGYFHPGVIRVKWEEHLTGKRNWQYDLWSVLMFQAWLEEQQPSKLFV